MSNFGVQITISVHCLFHTPSQKRNCRACSVFLLLSERLMLLGRRRPQWSCPRSDISPKWCSCSHYREGYLISCWTACTRIATTYSRGYAISRYLTRYYGTRLTGSYDMQVQSIRRSCKCLQVLCACPRRGNFRCPICA
jgi:hypothetical protein